ncbi:hypothetical protein LCGC14_0959160 [marine sediment metagenome]|uniref:Uncharacterized protein n=1 Tax=marine sediment metagenome TaxID=412755 RepID=A0A0F9NJN7_9ZZZZ
MTDEQKAAYINSQVICAQIELEAMKVANRHDEGMGSAPTYVEEDFRAIVDRFVIGHNDVIGFLHA